MKIYSCGNCHNALYFENNVCLSCQHQVGFDAAKLEMITLEPAGSGTFANIAIPGELVRFCQNASYGACNWLIPNTDPSVFCRACSLNRTIPALTIEKNLVRWKNIEIAKHRLIYSLLKLALPVSVKTDNGDQGLAFDFMADTSPDEKVVTGHQKGTITLNIEEADEAKRMRHKADLGEKYRTLLGHFRHEIGHYYWEVLTKDRNVLMEYRRLFGDERADYQTALEAYYNQGPPANWSDNYISPYASAHPWEDWAETWAHYLHMMDTLETAYYFGVSVDPPHGTQISITTDPYLIPDFNHILKSWLPLSLAMNSLSRSMGHSDFYPFVISAPVAQKLKFIHHLCKRIVPNRY
jgi:hypothetical protein